MKILQLSTLLFLVTALISSCSKEDKITPDNTNEIENLILIESFNNGDYTLELFNSSGQLKVGYNKIFLRLKDTDGQYLNQSSIEWMPMMTMNMAGMLHQHSCPFSEITKVIGKQTLFEGYIVFIMASDEPDNFWDLKINFTADGQDFEVNKKVNVISTDSDYNKQYTSAMGSDAKMYLLALVEPSKAKIGTNDISVALFQKGEHHDFPIVNNYKIKLDPRMPGMNNHSAPGNENMTQGSDGFYHGKVGFSMSGYWKINLILEDDSETLIIGEAVTEQNLESSLNFKLEF